MRDNMSNRKQSLPLKRLELWLLLLVVACAANVGAQGTVRFANSSTTLIINGLTGEPISPEGAFRIGLYMAFAADFNTMGESALHLVGLATNSSLPGRFAGDLAYAVPGFPAIDRTMTPTNDWYKFQFRAWSLNAGLTYEEALATQNPLYLAGTSAIGFVAPIPPPGGAAPLVGTTGLPGVLTTGFAVHPIPEPSPLGLIAITLGAMAIWRWRKGRSAAVERC